MAICCYALCGYSQILDNNIWCPPGATWIYHNYQTLYDGYSVWKYKKDTVFLGVNCKQIEAQHINYYAGPGTRMPGIKLNYYLYTSKDSVFYYDGVAFNFMYNFSAQIGDSIILKSNSRFSNCDSSFLMQNDTLKVAGIFSDTVNAFWIEKRINIVGNKKWIFGDVLKNIGPIISFIPEPKFSTGKDCAFSPNYSELFCYSDVLRGSIKFKQNSDSWFCHDIETSIQEPEKINSNWISIFPNPASNKLHIQSLAQQNFNYAILDIAGRQVQSGNINVNDPIDISNIASGLYIISLSVDKEVANFKFIKQ